MNGDRLFVGVFPTGISYADRGREKHGDYARCAFLPFGTLELEMEPDCPRELRAEITRHAKRIQARRGEKFETSASGQYVILGSDRDPARRRRRRRDPAAGRVIATPYYTGRGYRVLILEGEDGLGRPIFEEAHHIPGQRGYMSARPRQTYRSMPEARRALDAIYGPSRLGRDPETLYVEIRNEGAPMAERRLGPYRSREDAERVATRYRALIRERGFNKVVRIVPRSTYERDPRRRRRRDPQSTRAEDRPWRVRDRATRQRYYFDTRDEALRFVDDVSTSKITGEELSRWRNRLIVERNR